MTNDIRVLVTGGNGMLGQALAAELQHRNIFATIAGRTELDITDNAAVTNAIRHHTIVINTAAWTDVNAAETNIQAAYIINDIAAGQLAAACKIANIPCIHISTDYVFGQQNIVDIHPWKETDQPLPLNIYGRSKLAGEYAILNAAPMHSYIVRTAWLYDVYGRNFLTTMLQLARKQHLIHIVDDQWGQPTWAKSLAHGLVNLISAIIAQTIEPGIVHITANGATTWCRFARAIFEEYGLNPSRIRAITTDQYPSVVQRPPYSVLSNTKWINVGMQPLGHWRPMLAKALEDTYTSPIEEI